MDSKRIFVLGWYGHGNLGDECFKTAFITLWPQFEFTFGASIPQDINTAYDYLWVGGGSFLEVYQKGIENVTIPMGFVGVGLSANLHPKNKLALNKAKIVVVRDSLSAQFHPSAIVAPDLAFGTPPRLLPSTDTEAPTTGNKVVVLLNNFLATKGNNPSWQTWAFEWFNHEFAGACDWLTEEGYYLKFLPMGTGAIDDRRMAAFAIDHMKHPEQAYWGLTSLPEEELRDEIESAALVITQRFHGAIFSVQAGTPVIAMSVHDKLTSLVNDIGWPGLVNYYGFHKDQIKKVLQDVKAADPSKLSNYAKVARTSWESISGIVANAFSG